MSISIEELKKFLAEKSEEENTETLRIDHCSGTDSLVEQYRVHFITPREEKKEEPKKKSPVATKKAK